MQAVRRTVTSAKLKKNQAHARLYQKCQTALGGAKVPCTAPRPASLISSNRMYIYMGYKYGALVTQAAAQAPKPDPKPPPPKRPACRWAPKRAGRGEAWPAKRGQARP